MSDSEQNSTESGDAQSIFTVASETDGWQVILSSPSNKLVLYNAQQNSLAISDSRDWEFSDINVSSDAISSFQAQIRRRRRLSNPITGRGARSLSPAAQNSEVFCPLCFKPKYHSNSNPWTASQVRSYFALLSEVNLPESEATANNSDANIEPYEIEEVDGEPLMDESRFNVGYYEKFFVQEKRLGKGGQGEVFLVRHNLFDHNIGLFACKKVPIGSSLKRLPQLLQEIQVLGELSHPNLIAYHHSWVEYARFSSFGPPVPTLHILMQFANGSSLADFISRRKGVNETSKELTKEERIRVFRMKNCNPVHLLRIEEILSIFEDVCNGLEYLHSSGILHLDLKAENVLLHYTDDSIIPCAKISDLGNATKSRQGTQRVREGGTGTLDWLPPENWDFDSKTHKLLPTDRSVDLWALGLILHFLCFLSLPYREEAPDALENEIRAYPGFFPIDAHELDRGHHIPPSLLLIISSLVHRIPSKRIPCDQVLDLIQAVKEDVERSANNSSTTALVMKTHVNTPNLRTAKLRSVAPRQKTKSSTPKNVKSNANNKIVAAVSSSPQTRLVSQMGLIILSSSLLKVLLFHKACLGGPIALIGTYILVVETLVDVLLLDPRVSAALFLGHVLLLRWSGSALLCPTL